MKPSKEQVFEAFTNVVGYEYKYSDELEKLMLDAIQHSKEEEGTDHLKEIMNDTIWKKIGRMLQL